MLVSCSPFFVLVCAVIPLPAVATCSSIVDTDFSIQDDEVETAAKALLTSESRTAS